MKLVCLVKRKPGLSPEDFRKHYEEKHVPLAMKLLPYFSDYRRNYIRHDMPCQLAHLGIHAEVPEFDAVTEISFATPGDYDKNVAALADSAISKAIADDEDRFQDRRAMVIFFVDERVTPAEAFQRTNA